MEKKIIILDNSNGEVHVFPYDEYGTYVMDIVDFYDFVNKEFGLFLKDSQCSYMITEELNIQIH